MKSRIELVLGLNDLGLSHAVRDVLSRKSVNALSQPECVIAQFSILNDLALT